MEEMWDRRSRRTMGQFVQLEEKAEKESDRGRVKPPRVWWWLETSLTQTMRRRMTTSSAWRVCLWRLSSHKEMALWIILTPQTCTLQWHAQTHLKSHARTKRFHFTFSRLMSYKVCNCKRWEGDIGSLCRRERYALFVSQYASTQRWEINAALGNTAASVTQDH